MNYGLFDSGGCIRCTSYDLDAIILRRIELGWGTVREIRLSKNGLKFGKIIGETK